MTMTIVETLNLIMIGLILGMFLRFITDNFPSFGGGSEPRTIKIFVPSYQEEFKHEDE